jgi:hypothetical protein
MIFLMSGHRQTNCCADLSVTEAAPSTDICPRAYALRSQRDERASNFAALASAFAFAAANLAATFCSAAMARSSAFCAVATFFVAAAWVFVKVATGFWTPRFTLFLAAALRGPFFAAGFFGTLAISISNLAAILSSAVTNSESISAP